MALLCASISASAYDFEVDGICYNVISTINETCAVTASPVQLEGVIQIPAEVQYVSRKFTVKEIEDSAFKNNLKITEVLLGENLEKIGSSAFANCTNISKVVINCDISAAGTLEYPAFNNCTNITSLEFGDSIVKVPDYLMMGAGNFTELKLREGIQEIGDYSFFSHKELRELILPQSLKRIGKHSFENCASISTLSMPDNMEVLDGCAFSGCKSLVSIKISRYLKKISNSVFKDCERIDAVNLSDTYVSILGDSVFYNCVNLKDLQFSSKIEIIGSSSFAKCKNLQAVCLPASVTLIRSEAFRDCVNLSSVILNGCQAYIGARAFYGTSSLTAIDLCNGITGIGIGAFSSSGIETITIPNTVDRLDVNTFDSHLKELIIADGDSPIEFHMDYGTVISYSSYDNKVSTKHYKKYYYGDIAPAIEKLYLGRDVKYGPDKFYKGDEIEISSPIPETIKALTLGPLFTQVTKGFKHISRIGYYRSYKDYLEDWRTYKDCAIYKSSIIPSSLEEIKIINKIPPISYTDSIISFSQWGGSSIFLPSSTYLFTEDQYKKVKLYIPSGSIDNFKTAEIWENFLFICETSECDILISELNLLQDHITIGLGDINGINIDYTITPNTALNKKILFISENPEIAKVSEDGVVSPVSEGETNIVLTTCDGSKISKSLGVRVVQEVGFKNVYNTVIYMDMDISNYDNYFNYIPEITGPFSEDDFWTELLFLDKDNVYPDSQHVLTIAGGEYAGNYVNTNIDRPMYAGKYIFKLTPKRDNLNVVANPSQAYLTVNKTSNNLEWDADSPISVKVGEKIDLGIAYWADQWCDFVTDYDNELIELSSYDENGMTPHWYATGLKEGETYMSFRITCDKNDMGFYNFSDSQTVSKRIKVEPSSGIDGVETDNGKISVRTKNGTIFIYNKHENSIVRVFNLQGSLIKETEDPEVKNLSKGIYVVTVEDRSFKVML